MSSKRYRLLPLVCGLLCLILGCSHKASPNSLPHSVTLQWQAPSTVQGVSIVGYNVYRSPATGKEFVRIASRVPRPPYEDHLVVSGCTYTYAVTSVDQAGRESRFSKEVQAKIP